MVPQINFLKDDLQIDILRLHATEPKFIRKLKSRD